MTFVGADIDQLRNLASQMVAGADSLDQLRAMVATLTQVPWRGPDGDRFRNGTAQQAQASLNAVAVELRRAGTSLSAQATQQQQASAVDGGTGGGISNVYDNGDTYGTLPPEVAQKWTKMSDAERRAFLQALADEYAEKYGIDPVQISFEDLEDPPGMNRLGYWSEGQKKLVIDTDDVANPTNAINTLAHEMRHAGQYEMARDADPGFFARIFIGLGWMDDPFDHPGVTKEQALEWGDNFDNYISPEDDYQGYRDQPVEVDARTTGESEVNDMTEERFDDIRKRS